MTSGDVHHNGDVVNMIGGTGNTGIVKNQSPNVSHALSAEQRAAIDELVRLLEEHRGRIAPEDQEDLDGALPVLSAPGVQLPERRRALRAVAGVVATSAAFGAPVLELVNRIGALLGTP
ncbi:hypothetical protein [Streptomyces sp. NPDC090022]|uniref:hypothetical protein n=1 Tax=Streptomyces sp. NPDC090022 TaxID=3365920 RepID=UPI00380A6320